MSKERKDRKKMLTTTENLFKIFPDSMRRVVWWGCVVCLSCCGEWGDRGTQERSTTAAGCSRTITAPRLVSLLSWREVLHLYPNMRALRSFYSLSCSALDEILIIISYHHRISYPPAVLKDPSQWNLLISKDRPLSPVVMRLFWKGYQPLWISSTMTTWVPSNP